MKKFSAISPGPNMKSVQMCHLVSAAVDMTFYTKGGKHLYVKSCKEPQTHKYGL